MTSSSHAPAASRARRLQRVVSTTDVHSALGNAAAMAAHLDALRGLSLIADCGDFFEGTGYYILGGGQAEVAMLTGLYDVVAPGNHGYCHHLQNPGLFSITVCANVTDRTGAAVFAPSRTFEISGSNVAVTAILGAEAFASIPPDQRAGHQISDPAAALRSWHGQHRSRAGSWIVLSHAGFDHDLALARACPFVDVIFSGHCHSETSGPVTVGGVTVVKGSELGAGYATARPGGGRWHAETCLFPPPDLEAEPPRALVPVLARLSRLRATLSEPIGVLDERFASRTPTRHELLSRVAQRALALTGADAAMINETCLRPSGLGTVLHAGDLLALEPFGNALTCVEAADPPAVAQHLAERSGPLACTPQPSPARGRPTTVVTTDYLAGTHLADYPRVSSPARPDARPQLVRDLLREILLGADSRL